jgi:dihydroorotase
MGTLLILNAKIVNENTITESDIYIRSGRIEKIGKDLSAMKVQQVLDIKGKFILPGMIDANVHFQQNSSNTECNNKSCCNESHAAVVGGVTTYFDIPNSHTLVESTEQLEEKMLFAAEHSLANYSYYLGALNNNIEEIKSLDPRSSCGIHVFMGGARDGRLVDEPEQLNTLFKHSPTLLNTHCEDTPTIIENEESYRQLYGDEIPFQFHPTIRTAQACYKSTKLALELAVSNQVKLHISHISSAQEVELFSDLPLAEKQITGEVGYQYLVFTDEDYSNNTNDNKTSGDENFDVAKGAQIKVNPAIKSDIDRASLFQSLMDGCLDTIASVHKPVTLKQKRGNYFQALSGNPLIEYSLPSLLEHYQDGIFSLELIAQKTSHAVADIFQIKNRGYIREGYWADLVVIDTKNGTTASNDSVLSKAGWTPFDGFEFRSSVYATIVNGDLVYINHKVRIGTNGRRVEFNRETNN